MKQLIEDLKKNKFCNIYIFCGQELFLKEHYFNKLKEKILNSTNEIMNLDIFEGKNCDIKQIKDSFSTIPFMSDYRICVIKESGLLGCNRKEDSEKFCSYIELLSETSILIFWEDDIDKRSKLYKKIIPDAKFVEFKTPSEKDLMNWVKRYLNKYNKIIDDKVCGYLLYLLPNNMNNIFIELNKLVNYKYNQNLITIDDVNSIISKTLEIKIFDLVSAVIYKKSQTAFEYLNVLKTQKMQPSVILIMLNRQIRLIFLAQQFKDSGYTNEEIAKKLNLRTFVINECIKQSKSFTKEELLDALNECQNIDIKIKTGKISGYLAIELLIIKYVNR